MTPLRLRIRELRDEKGLSQQALADLADVRQATISDIESGRAFENALGVIDRLAKALGVEPAELLERTKARAR